jgi:serine protease Do
VEPQRSSGTGFFVSNTHVLTNWHVIEDADQFQISLCGGQPSAARKVAEDPINDLALLETKLKPTTIPILRPGVQVGEDVAVYGFPFLPVGSAFGTFTIGNVNATSWEEDAGWLVMQTPIHPGNSGGPVLDQSGNVVAITNAGLVAYQNVNFAIKTEVILNFLATHRVYLPTKSNRKTRSWPDIAQHAKSFSVYVECNVPNGLEYDDTPSKRTGLWGEFMEIFGRG